MKLKGSAGVLSMIVAVLLASSAARGDNSKSEFNWSMPGLDKWLLGMYSDGLAGWDVEPEKRVPREVSLSRLVPCPDPPTKTGNATLLAPAIWELMFDPPLSDVYPEWDGDRPASFEPNKIWAESFELVVLPGPKLSK
jgi:hypothetical protein